MAAAAGELERLRSALAERVARDGLDAHQVAANRIAWAYARSQAARAAREWAAATGDELAERIATAAEAEAAAELGTEGWQARVAAEEALAAIWRAAESRGGPPLDELGAPADERELRASYRDFSDHVVRPWAHRIHREVLDIPDQIIEGAAELGLFGLTTPREYGGGADGEPDYRRMLIATEELARGSLNAGGSLITRPEILVRALVRAGTEEQRRRWLPDVAAGRKMVAVAVSEPEAGSDVAALSACRAERRGERWVLNGRKRWAGFSARAELIVVLARTGPPGHGGLSMLVAEKPRLPGPDFEWRQPGGGRIEGRAIPILGYRGMHTYDLFFDDFAVDGEAVIGGEEWLNRGFYLQMESFAVGRLQTSARAVGVMRAALEDASAYTRSREVFGAPVASYQLPQAMLGRALMHATTARQLALQTAADMESREGQTRASLAKLYACHLAEEAARDCMQLWGGNGYAEESPASRHFLDARVLTIFEGAEEVLALKVIARALLEED